MLRITKGLNPFVNNDASEGISIYTDEQGNKYVCVKTDDEDFCIAAHDYNQGVKYYFSWDNAMEALEAIGMTTFTKEQFELYMDYHNEINKKLKEIGGDVIEGNWYWLSTESNVDTKCAYFYGHGVIDNTLKKITRRVRPILNL